MEGMQSFVQGSAHCCKCMQHWKLTAFKSLPAVAMLIRWLWGAGVFGAVGGALVDAHHNKGEVAALERRAADLRSAKQTDLQKGVFTDESAAILQ